MSGWQAEDVERQSLATLTYRGDDGQPRALLTADVLLLVGFVTAAERDAIWEALCADVAAARSRDRGR
jgi:hypothetical protein